MPQIEITEAVEALDEAGRPVNSGWARAPLFIYNPSRIVASRLRITESDRYIVFSPTHMVTLELLDDGFLGSMCVSVVSFKDKKRSTQSYHTPFPLGAFNLPSDSDSTSIKFKHKRNLFNFALMEKGIRIVKVDVRNFGRREKLVGEVVLTPPFTEAQSLATHMAWREKGDAFSCSLRSPWYTVEGVIQHGQTELLFSKDTAWGIFDWNRGVRPRKDLRFWAAGSGLSSGRQVSFSVGHSSADPSNGTENAFFVDGILHKLDTITFHIPSGGKLSPWRFTSNDGRLEMTFEPQQERDETLRMFFSYLKRRQLFGTFSGKALLDDGYECTFSGITGFAERRKSQS